MWKSYTTKKSKVVSFFLEKKLNLKKIIVFSLLLFLFSFRKIFEFFFFFFFSFFYTIFFLSNFL